MTASRRTPLVVGIVLAIVVVGLVAADRALAGAAEGRAAERAEEVLGAPADVQLTGWPVGWRLVAGRPVDVVLSARDVPLPDGDGVLDVLEVELDGVRAGLGMLDEPSSPLRAEQGRFVAELGDDAVQQRLGVVGRIPLVDVELRSGVVRLNVARFPAIDATAEIDDGQVLFRPTAPIAGFVEVELRLEELPFGFVVDDVTVRPGTLRLSGSATNLDLGRPAP